MTAALVSLFWIALTAAVSPLLTTLTRGRIPDVVWLLALGVLIGPAVLGLAEITPSIAMVRELGLGVLFLIAGFEIDGAAVRSRTGWMAALAWLISMVGSVALLQIVLPRTSLLACVALSVALTSTALGTLVPILREAGEVGTPLGRTVLVHGAVGEIMPILTMTLLLTSRGAVASIVLLLSLVLLAVVGVLVPLRSLRRIPGLGRAILAGSRTTQQTGMRLIMLLLTGLMALSAMLDIDVVLGAFAAGVIVRAVLPERVDHAVSGVLTVTAYSLLVPVFFVTSGMAISLEAVVRNPMLLILSVLLIGLVRGAPIWLLEFAFRTGSGIRRPEERVRLALYTATGLPIIVAVTEVATAQGLMASSFASILVAAGAMTVLLFPLLASLVGNVTNDHRRRPRVP